MNAPFASPTAEWEDKQEEYYRLYRGKCRMLSEALVAANPKLRLVRGHYYCPFWGPQAHWWCVDESGAIQDPTRLQFPSEGEGDYVEFDGICECEECGKRFPEADGSFYGNHAFCSNDCIIRHVL